MQIKLKPIDYLIFLGTWYVQVLLLAVIVVLTYGHTLGVPFYLDDFSSIQENPIIYNWQGSWAELWPYLKELWQYSALRIVGYLSFAFNYQIHQFQVAGYHVVNIFIHFLTGVAILGLIRGLVHTPTLNTQLSENAKRWLPFIVALIFLLHPLQIQGVTYIVQRLASLAAFFYIAAMACFVQARLNSSPFPFLKKKNSPTYTEVKGEKLSIHTKGKHQQLGGIFWILACLLFSLLAFFTKQNTITLPIVLLLMELIFFHRYEIRLKGVITLLGFGISLIILFLVVEQNPIFQKFLFEKIPFLEHLDTLTRETMEISRTSYLATQMKVLWKYIILFFWPTGLHIDYDNARIFTEKFLYESENYHIIARLLHSEVILFLGGHFLLLGLAIYSLRKWPLVTYGILFYYLAHAVESSIIPIRDVIFEHRTYLPNLGLAVLCAWILVVKLPQWLSQRFAQVIIVILLFVLGSTTWLRNHKWRDPVALWQHNVEQSPNKKRGWVILGKHLVQKGQSELETGKKTLLESIKTLEHAIAKKRNPDGSVKSMSVTPETALNLIVAHKTLRQYDEALTWVKRALALKHNLRPFDHAKFLVNQGNIFYELGRYHDAEKSYRQALQIYPSNLKARINLASVLGATGHFNEAIAIYQEVLTINPSNAYVKENLQNLQKLRQRRGNEK
ncbi:tetratricopeptide repeat protein [Candidatus Parabeggiatoa sp. HSG14]|uniref:tetratricopeptide repeat protein n=1 Tax=Candidatus Parabeggiatoa sp. HSG14 TaxID=3055593 RepID=UPI0025A7E01C|nr:tetratricopeptide repeat protein [Thiotrichales bacterium HSG14]